METERADAPAPPGSRSTDGTGTAPPASSDGGQLPRGPLPRDNAAADDALPSVAELLAHRAATGDGVAVVGGEEAEARRVFEPRLRSPERETPLPEVDRALEFLKLFPAIVRGRRARFKIALLRTLQGSGSGRWKLRRLQQVVHWLEPHSTTELVGELREAGVLEFDDVRRFYRLTPEARVVTAILSALTIRELDPRRVIKLLNVAIRLALESGAGARAAFEGFASAVAQLRADEEELERLIDDGAEDALLEAAELVSHHVEDMQDLLDEHVTFRAQHADDPDFLQLEQDALDLVPRLGKRAALVIRMLTERAEQRMRGGARVDRADIREFLAQAEDLGILAGIVAGLAAPPPFLPGLNGALALDLLEVESGRVRPEPPPLPEPEPVERLVPPPRYDPTRELAGELFALAAPTPVTDVVVRESWTTAVRRHNALVDAYSRRNLELPALEHEDAVDEPRRFGVWRISRSTIRPKEPRP
jgi:hypothetical protein